MAIFETTSPARCKHCKHLDYSYPLKNDGTPSKRKRYFCSNFEQSGRTWNLSPMDKVCDAWELK